MLFRPILIRALAALLGLAPLAGRAHADYVVHTTSVPLTTTPFDVAVPTPKFDTLLGTLESVTVTFAVQPTVASGLENTEASPIFAALTRGVEGEAYAEDDSTFATAVSAPTTTRGLAAYDGTTDYTGASGLTIASTQLTSATGSNTRTDSGVLALYSGPSGNPGTAGTRVRATGIGIVTGGDGIVSTYTTQAAFVSITVRYDYEPRVKPFCFGDGSGTECPCSNESSAETGCLNSFGYGSLLSATGGAAVSADTLVLSATVPGTNAVMFFQGTATPNGGAGALFGDGLRCTDGTVIRLVSTAAVGGIATFPSTGDPSVSTAGEVPSGATRYYQVWYRNAAEFCTEETFNLSNGLRVDWDT